MGTTTDRATLSLYRSELANLLPPATSGKSHATLSPEVEHALALRWRKGDRVAGTKLVEACLPFVMTIALEYRRWGLSIEDIVQEGNVGLLKAADRFDPDRGCRLATYAAYWIRAEIREYVARGYRIVRLGSSKSERRALRIYRKTHERNPEELARLSGMTPERATELLPLLIARDVSFDRTPTSEEGKAPFDRIASTIESPEDQAADNAEKLRMRTALKKVIAELSPRERRIVKQRWLTEDPKTLEELGIDFGVSKERVRQLEERAKRRIRERLVELGATPAA